MLKCRGNGNLVRAFKKFLENVVCLEVNTKSRGEGSGKNVQARLWGKNTFKMWMSGECLPSFPTKSSLPWPPATGSRSTTSPLNTITIFLWPQALSHSRAPCSPTLRIPCIFGTMGFSTSGSLHACGCMFPRLDTRYPCIRKSVTD